MSTTAGDWVQGARPRTLSTAVTPVVVGTAAAASLGSWRPGLALLALAVAVALQVGVNYANDYSDGVRGTDADRVGPMRLVASGRARPSAVRMAAFVSLSLGAVLGLAIVVLTQRWWLLAVGILAVVAAWTYTGGSRPYGYSGGGEISVFFFYGPVATLGTLYIQFARIPWWSVIACVGVGATAVAMLLVNNLRDLQTDALAGKRTLAVRVGDRWARRLLAASVALPLLCSVAISPARPWALLTLLLLLPTCFALMAIVAAGRGAPWRAVFATVSGLGLLYGLLLGLGIALGGGA